MINKNNQPGHLHPISQMTWQASQIFAEMGFSVVEGTEIETEFFNFDALNIPAGHPARGMQDTFWLNPLAAKKLLITHDTTIDARYLSNNEPPFRIVTPSRVFRNEATDATHEAQFYQFGGLVVEENVSLGHLKGILEHFYKKLLGSEISLRFRPSYFSFVEPGMEIDIKWRGQWLEVCGAGLSHPNVFTSCKRDSSKWRGLAFGSAIDRLVMIKYGVEDIRHFYSGDQRFLKQF